MIMNASDPEPDEYEVIIENPSRGLSLVCSSLIQRCVTWFSACRKQHHETLIPAAVQTQSPPCGLVNLGNTCYMNSALQCLSGVVPLREHLAVAEFQSDTKRDCEIGAGPALAISFSKLLKKMWSEEFSAVRADDLKALFEQYVNVFSGFSVNDTNRFGDHSQQDSHEFLTYMLQSLHEDLNRPIPLTGSKEEGVTALTDEEEQKLSDKELGNRKWTQYLEYNNSKVVELFQGQYKTTMTCGKQECGKVMRTFDPFMFLPLPIPDDTNTEVSSPSDEDIDGMCTHTCTLKDCLELWTKEQSTVKKNWYCDGCDRDVDGKKKVYVWKPPQYLIIQLKRFRANEKVRYKMNTPIDLPVSLDLSPFVQDSEDSPVMYGLFAVITHKGSIQGGHYTAVTKHGGRWYKFNDETVTSEAFEESVKHAQSAYVLFYERESTENHETESAVTPDTQKKDVDQSNETKLEELA